MADLSPAEDRSESKEGGKDCMLPGVIVEDGRLISRVGSRRDLQSVIGFMGAAA